MHIVLFDVDGTLIQSQTVDADLYRLSLQSVFAFADISIDWSVYTNTTDTGIFHEIFSARRDRAPSPNEVERFRSHFVAAVDQEARRLPFSEIRGARAMLANLVRLPEHRIGLATGGWSASARIKLLSAAIEFDAYPSATSDDALSKAEVMSIALERVCAACECTEPTSVVYVGDSRWDAMTSRKLNIPFIGIGSAEHVQLLHDEGAIEVLPDYANLIAVGAALSSAQRACRRVTVQKG